MTAQILRAPLPRGLRAVARRDRYGRLVITLNSALSPAQQRAAVREIRRIAGRKGWLPGIVIPVAAAAVRAGKHPAALAVGAAIAAGTAAALAVVVMPAAPGLRPVQQSTPAPGDAPLIAVARPHSHRRRQDGAAVSVTPAGLPAVSAPSPAALATAPPPLPDLPLPHLHVRVRVRVHLPQLPLPVTLPSPEVKVCVPLHLLGSGACADVAA